MTHRLYSTKSFRSSTISSGWTRSRTGEMTNHLHLTLPPLPPLLLDPPAPALPAPPLLLCPSPTRLAGPFERWASPAQPARRELTSACQTHGGSTTSMHRSTPCKQGYSRIGILLEAVRVAPLIKVQTSSQIICRPRMTYSGVSENVLRHLSRGKVRHIPMIPA